MDVDKELKHVFWRRTTRRQPAPNPQHYPQEPTPPPDENALRHICFTSAWSYSNSSLDASQTARSRPLLRQPEL